MLTQGGKDILIKAVASAIPTYIMDRFKVPKKCCEEMNAVMANFWWGREKIKAKYIGKAGRS